MILAALLLGLPVPLLSQTTLIAQSRLPLPVAWDAMPALPYRTPPPISPQMSQWVAGEIVRSKCPAARVAGGRASLRVDVAVLLSGDGSVRAAIPRAIDCPTVEQYSAGLVSSFARNNLMSRPGDGSGWFRATLVYDWPA